MLTRRRRLLAMAAVAAVPLATGGMIWWVVYEARAAAAEHQAFEAVLAKKAELTCDEIHALTLELGFRGEAQRARIEAIWSGVPYVGGTLGVLSLLVFVPVRRGGNDVASPPIGDR